jgi:hypothetical protein
VNLPAGLKMSRALQLIDLDGDRRFRWVAPESLVRGLTSEDIASVASGGVLRLRESVQTLFFANGWRLTPDSAVYEYTVFTAARTEMRPETRTEQTTTSTSGLPRCDESRGGAQARCSNNPVNSRTYVVHVPVTTRLVFHLVRRRADGAVRLWVNQAENLPAADATVARDLLRLLLSRAPD